MPTWPAPRTVSSLSAISYTALKVGANLRESRLSIWLIITSSSSLVSFFKLASQSRHKGTPARRLRSVVLGTLNVAAACLLLGICVVLIAEIARRISASL